VIKIGITSNIKEYYKGYIDFLDHYWIEYFGKKKADYKLIPNNTYLSEKILKKINLLILAGGNDIISKKKDSLFRNKIEKNLINKAVKKKIPILGICRGAQLLNMRFGGKIKKVKNQMRTRHNVYIIKNEFIKKNILNVNSFHNYGIKKNNLSKKFIALAIDKEKNIEMFMSKKHKIIGVMWHPEREKSKKILTNLIKKLTKQ
jgi:putative glutamine amidotransferase